VSLIGAPLLSVWAFGVLAPVPLQRDYAGPSGVELPARLQSATPPAKPASKPPPQPAGDLSMDDVFGTGAPPAPATSPGGTTGTTGTTAPASAPAGGDKKPDDLSMDDVFGGGGTTPGPAAGGATPTPTPTPAPAQADTDKTKKKPVQSASEKIADATNGKLRTRFRIVSSVYYDVDRAEPRKISRNENRLEFYFAYTPNKHVQVVGDVEPVLMGVSQAQELDDLASQVYLQRFHLESDAAYVALTDLAPGLDIKVGRQIVVWGTADKFNPTNNINPDDLEDRPLFTEPIANQMVVVDYAPLKRDRDKLYFQGVYVPLFFPALLPPSAAAGLKDPYAESPFVNATEINKLTYLQDDFLVKNPKLLPLVYGHVEMPEAKFTNGQFAFKLGSRLGEVDLSASYYYGRHDIPLAVDARTTMTAPLNQEPPPDNGYYFRSDVRLIYPKMQVIGLDFATQIPFLGNMGLWGEGALIIPEASQFHIDLPPLPGGGVDVTPDDGVANPEAFIEGVAIKAQPFIKATVGFDYTFGKHVYVQSQYLRGMINEFGAGHIGNYLLGGTDIIFFGRKLVFRAFGMVDFPSNNPKNKGPSAVIAPAILFAPPWGYVNFEVGSFALLGGDRTYFGQKATGSSILYVKVIGSF
jgi:hypothetical protein